MVTIPRKSIATATLAVSALLASCLGGVAMELTSPDVANGKMLSLAQVNSRCGGENRSPAMAWSGAPAGTKSFALTLFDPDARGGRGFWHWLMIDIPAGSAGLREGAGSGAGLPAGAVQSANDFGETGYGGACPPPGSRAHHYVFTLYAMGTPKVPETGAGTLAVYLKSHALAAATLAGLYKR
ncbi:MAG: YbhB/YbcL family Raf kinase inhibitor-like protein [Rhizomicrobium sp.]